MDYKKILAVTLSLSMTCASLSGTALLKSENNTTVVNALSPIAQIVNVTPESVVLYKGQEIKINVTLESFAAKQEVTFSSKDKSVAVVDSEGIVKAVGKGKTEIVVQPVLYGESKTVSVLVAEEPEETEDFSWLPHSDEEYNEFTEKYSTVACLNGYIILSEDPCEDGGYSITETHEGTAEYSLYKEYNVRTGALAPMCL